MTIGVSKRWRAAVITTAVVAMVGLPAMPASAHVTVNPKEATVGGYTRLTFWVPNEKANASTVKLEVAFPEEAPFASVSVKPVPGWTVTTEKRKLATPIKNHDTEITEATSKIIWTADNEAVAIKPGQFQEFDVSAGPVPEVSQVVFKSLQTYSDGDTVRWIDIPEAGKTAEHPAPVLKVVPKAASAASTAPVANTSSTNGDSEESGSGWPLGLSILDSAQMPSRR